jgi:hypothetical protein
VGYILLVGCFQFKFVFACVAVTPFGTVHPLLPYLLTARKEIYDKIWISKVCLCIVVGMGHVTL